MLEHYGTADREMFLILHVNVKNEIIDEEVHAIGTVDSSAVYPREVMRSALLANASALVFAHNHPTGDPTPSFCDREITRDLIRAAHVIGVKVLDHIVIGHGRYFSFADHGLIADYEAEAEASLKR